MVKLTLVTLVTLMTWATLVTLTNFTQLTLSLSDLGAQRLFRSLKCVTKQEPKNFGCLGVIYVKAQSV